LIQNLPSLKAKQATGGPSVGDQKDLANLLNTSQHDISWNRLLEKTGFLKNEAQTQIAD